ncbi:MAG TPA: HAD-IA family hydrolase [Bacillota bacterium]
MTKKIIYAFDWDNTLIDSHRKGIRCMCKALAALDLFFTENSINEIYCPDYHEMYKKLNIPEERWEKLDNLWLEYYLHEKQVYLFPEVREVLTKLSTRGNILALITTGQRARVHQELKYLNLTHFFPCIICREDVLKVKPAPDAIEKLKNYYHSSDLIYIGDHDHDVKMAKNAKVRWYRIVRDDNGDFPTAQNIINDLRKLLILN